MFQPEDPLAPPRPTFAEPWQAQVLALADAMVQKGYFSSDMWAKTLGANLHAAEASGAPDTEDTYYAAALTALETLSAAQTDISASDLLERKQAWETAYRQTPHGKPVELRPK